jgi:hypothetical protein
MVWIQRGQGDSFDDMPVDEGDIIEQVTPISVRIRNEGGIKIFFFRHNVEFRYDFG